MPEGQSSAVGGNIDEVVAEEKQIAGDVIKQRLTSAKANISNVTSSAIRESR